MLTFKTVRAIVRNIVPALLIAPLAGVSAGAASPTTCAFQFDAVAEVPYGTLSQGDALEGTVEFTLNSTDEDSQSRDYLASGTLTLTRPGHGGLSGKVGIIRVTRSPHVADALLIDVRHVRGNLGAVTRYTDPLVFTLYGERGLLKDFSVPVKSGTWNALGMKRTVQFHSPDADNPVLHEVGLVRGGCT